MKELHTLRFLPVFVSYGAFRQRHIPYLMYLVPGKCCISNRPFGERLALQLRFVSEGGARTLI